MAFTTRPSAFGSAPIRFDVTPWVKRLLMANAVVFLATVAVGYATMFEWFAFQPRDIVFRPWGPVTYMFVHGGLMHLAMNMIVLFFFGPPLENRWGEAEFLRFYLICGLGGVALSYLFLPDAIVGASAATYGVMLAFAMIVVWFRGSQFSLMKVGDNGSAGIGKFQRTVMMDVKRPNQQKHGEHANHHPVRRRIRYRSGCHYRRRHNRRNPKGYCSGMSA